MKKLLVICFVLVHVLLSAATLQLNIRLDVPSSYSETELLKAGYGFVSTPSSPRLPYKTVNVLLPPDAQPFSQSSRLGSELRFAADAPSINQGFISEAGILKAERSRKLHSQVVPLGLKRWGELQYLSYRVLPAVFEDGEWLWHNSLDLQIEYNDSGRVNARLPFTFSGPDFFANGEDLPRWYGGEPDRQTHYLIISTPALYQAAMPLVQYRSNFTVSFADIAVIQQTYPGANPAEKLRNFLIERYNQSSLDYLLLIGDVDLVPTAYLCPEPDGFETVPSDFYFCDLSSIWDADNDGRLGEYYLLEGEQDWLVDYTPECFVGRISTNQSAEVTAICNRIVAFEQSNAPWKQKALLPAAFLNYHDEPELGFLQTDGAGFMNYLRETVLQNYQTRTLYEHAGFLPSDASDLDLDYDILKNQISSESWGILNWSAHGSSYSSSRRVWLSDDNQNNLPDSWEMQWMNMVNRQSFDNLSNQDGTVIFAASCNNGMVDANDVSLGEYSLIKKSVGTLAATRTGWYKIGWSNPGWGGLSSYNYHWLENYVTNGMSIGVAHAFTNLLHTQIYMFGDPVDSGGIIYPELQNIYTYMLFGDPALGERPVEGELTHKILIYEPRGESGIQLQNSLHAMQTANTALNNLNVVYSNILIPVGTYNPQSYLDQFSAIFCLFADPQEPHLLVPFSDEYNQLDSYLSGGGKLYLEGPGDWGAMDGFWSRFRMHQPLNTVIPIEEFRASVDGNPFWTYTGEELVSPFVALGGFPLFLTNSETPWLVGVYTTNQTDDIRTIGSLFRLGNVAAGDHSYQELVELIVQFLLYGQPVSTVDPVQTQILLSSYPNPFNPSTTISFHLPQAGRTSLRLYNLRGQMVRELLDTQLASGQETLVFDGRDSRGEQLGSGVYFLRLEQGRFRQNLKLLLLK